MVQVSENLKNSKWSRFIIINFTDGPVFNKNFFTQALGFFYTKNTPVKGKIIFHFANEFSSFTDEATAKVQCFYSTAAKNSKKIFLK